MSSNEFTLKVVKGPLDTQVFEFAKKTIHIGSCYANNDLIMNVEGISARHSRIWREKHKFFIQNLCDNQSTIVDRIPLAKKEIRELESGTEIDMGDISLRFINDDIHHAAAHEINNHRPEKVIDGGHRPAASQTRFKKIISITGVALCIFFVLIMAVHGMKKDKKSNDSAKPYPIASSEEPIALPAKDKYGYIKNDDKSHPDKATFTFETDSSNVELYYTAGGIDSEQEVSIHLNGQHIGYAAMAKGAWGKEMVVRLPKEAVNKGGLNHLVFDNMENPPNYSQWAVKNIWIKTLAANLCDVEKARKLFELGEEMYEQKTISKGNLYMAHRYYYDAVSHLQDCDKDMDILRQAEIKKENSMQELDAFYNSLKFAFQKAYKMNDFSQCRSILQNMVLHIPDKSDERHKDAAEKLDEYNRYFQSRRK